MVCHAAELPFVFGNANTAEIYADSQQHALEPDEQRLSRSMIDYWARFAKHQDPNGLDAKANGDGQPQWAPFTAASPTRFILDLKTESKTDLDANCSFWDEIGYKSPGFLERVREF